ncbi:MAG: hypothetical protein KF870_07325 [Leadbetterella sp.]|nr:hypothetical protein [Leadbetterella sp.]
MRGKGPKDLVPRPWFITTSEAREIWEDFDRVYCDSDDETDRAYLARKKKQLVKGVI